MTGMAQQLDDLGRPAWILLMVAGFVLYWPIGLAILAYTIWSGRMRHGYDPDRLQRKMARMQEKMNRWGACSPRYGAYSPTGNHAFDDYRSETLRRLEDEEREFHAFVQRLRQARDREEFEAFMAERRNQTGGKPGDLPTVG